MSPRVSKERLIEDGFIVPWVLVPNSLRSKWRLNSRSQTIEVSFDQLQEIYDIYLASLNDHQIQYAAALAQSNVVEDSRSGSQHPKNPKKILSEYQDIIEIVNKLLVLYPQLANVRNVD